MNKTFVERVAEVIENKTGSKYRPDNRVAAAEIEKIYREKLLAEPISEYVKSEIERRLSE
jgi:hypothetical protein